MSFDTLGLNPAILTAIRATGFTEPTPVQAQAIPEALAGKDLMVSSQTGSGKTAAFMLPALHQIAQHASSNKGTGVQVLVLTPTRELAQQVSDATEQFGKELRNLRCAVVVGGTPYGAQLKALSRRVDVLVATPGRLIDHIKAGRVQLNTVHTLILDEADRMLDMGFIEDIEMIVGRLPTERQTLLFSATLDGTVGSLAQRMMRDPQRIVISTAKERHTNIKQSLLYADDVSHKRKLLDHLLRDTSVGQAIVFTATKHGADELSDLLAENGFSSSALHGDMNQRQRTRTLAQLQKGHLRVLVATDVAARGIDVQGISHAINFDLPMQAEDYVHRIGRTGRAGREGFAFTLATHGEVHKVRRIERYIGQTFEPTVIEGLEPSLKASSRRPSTGGRPGMRGGKPAGGGRSYGGGRSEARPAYGDSRPAGARPSFEGRDGAPRDNAWRERAPREGAPREGAPREGGWRDRAAAPREGGWQPRPEGRPERRPEGAAGHWRDARDGAAPRSAEGSKWQARPATAWQPRGDAPRGDAPQRAWQPRPEGGWNGAARSEGRPEGGARPPVRSDNPYSRPFKAAGARDERPAPRGDRPTGGWAKPAGKRPAGAGAAKPRSAWQDSGARKPR